MRVPPKQYWHVNWRGGSTIVEAVSKYAAKKSLQRNQHAQSPYSFRKATDDEIKAYKAKKTNQGGAVGSLGEAMQEAFGDKCANKA